MKREHARVLNTRNPESDPTIMESSMEWRDHRASDGGASNSDYPVSSSTFRALEAASIKLIGNFAKRKKLRSRWKLWGLTISVKGTDAKLVVPLNDSRACNVTRTLSRWNYMNNYDYIHVCVCVCIHIYIYMYALTLLRQNEHGTWILSVFG